MLNIPWNQICERQWMPFFFGHHKNYANEITCKLSAQHATVNVYKNKSLNWIIWKDTKTLPATFISSVKLKPEYLLKQMFI